MLRHPTPGPVPVPRPLRWCVHLLVAGLLLLCVVRAVALPVHPVAGVVAAAATLAVVYTVGTRRPAVERSATAARRWLAVLGLSWLLLLGFTADAVYLAFVGFFLALHLLPRRAGIIAVGGSVVAAIVGFAWHQQAFTVAMAIGPILGAAVVIATVRGYQALHAESEHRQQLIDALQETRAEVTLTAAGDRLTLDIVDDGVGFDAAVVDTQRTDGGFGLQSMASRAAEVGGVISVESEPAQGTAVAVTVTAGVRA